MCGAVGPVEALKPPSHSRVWLGGARVRTRRARVRHIRGPNVAVRTLVLRAQHSAGDKETTNEQKKSSPAAASRV